MSKYVGISILIWALIGATGMAVSLFTNDWTYARLSMVVLVIGSCYTGQKIIRENKAEQTE